ncbi:mechanosensitive ion channel [Cyanobium sp. NIES-981]|uniref:mechanosensitive ion channel n=1 Tax=Cyanobium sp. NIES-981 TaxID=1851505 RepID=UPI00155F6BD5|nr:mechanosensitive ion channel [Cyanobium sp. NIES-981]
MAGIPATLMPLVVNLLGALAILLVGWLVAALAARSVRSLLRRTQLDERVSNAIQDPERPGQRNLRLDRLLAALVFWVVLVLAVVAALNALNLTTVSEPLNDFLSQIFSFLPQLGAAGLLAALGWMVASLARALLLQTAQQLQLDERLFSSPEDDQSDDTTPGLLSSHTLANLLYWLILLFFLPLVLNALNLGSQLLPLLNLLNEFMAAVPLLAKAAAIAVVGWLLARTVRSLVRNLLGSTGLDHLGEGMGLDPEQPGQSLSSLGGTLSFVLVLIPTAIAALEALAMPAIAGPAIGMLNTVLGTLPQVFTAAAILAVAVVLGRFLEQLAVRLFTGFGFDHWVQQLGLVEDGDSEDSPQSRAAAQAEAVQGDALQGDAGLAAATASTPRRPSEVIGVAVLGAVVLFGAVAAANVLNLPAITEIVSGLLLVFGRILAGVIVFAFGLAIANFAARLIVSSQTVQAGLLAQAARVGILGFSGAMALQQIGVAPSIVTLAFGLVLGSIAVAAAVAFGVGGREVAAEQLREWRDALRQQT